MPHPITRRMSLWALTAALIVPASKGFTMFTLMSDEDLVKNSDIIVTATLVGIDEIPGPPPRRVGNLSVVTVLQGDPDLREIHLALPAYGGIRSSTDITYPLGSTGLWFLRALETQTPQLFTADAPQRFVPATEAARVIEAIGAYLPEHGSTQRP